jgi:putative endonuclease
MTKKSYYVYILASGRNGTLYIGVTSNIVKRIWEHKNSVVKGFTSKYKVHVLVYFEEFDDIYQALTREKNLKKWPRKWKLDLIEKNNSEWHDLYNEIVK